MANFFDDSSKISNNSIIDISNFGTNTYIGANSVIDDFVKIKHVAGNKDIFIGSNVYINSGTVIYSGNGVKIGNDVLIGPNCNIVPANHQINSKNQLIRLQGFSKSKGGIVIEDDVWLGANVTVLDGSIIRKGAVIGANSIVSKEVNEYSINYGVPLKEIGSRK